MEKGPTALLIFTITCICIATIIGLTLHFTIRDVEKPRSDVTVDCHPDPGSNKGACQSRGCQWQPNTEGGPSCVFISGVGYVAEDIEETVDGTRAKLIRRNNVATPFGEDNYEELALTVEYQTDYRVRIKIAAADAFEVPSEALNILNPGSATSNRLYDVILDTEAPDFGIKVIRKATNATIFDTTVPGMQYAAQFLQLTTRLNSSKVYGFGEHNHRQFQHNMNFKTWAMFTRDVAPVDEWNLYGHQTLYTNIETTNHVHGVVWINSNAQEVALQPDPHPGITFRALGGVFDFYIFMGPSPEEVVQQYTEATGRSIMPPYWALGFQLCRWDYSNLTHVKNVVERNLAAGIPLDVQYGDIDYMESKLDFTVDKVNYAGLAEFVDELHRGGMRYIVIQDHCIGSNTTLFDEKLRGYYKPYAEGIAQDIFIKKAYGSDEILEGEVWPGPVYYPDFTEITKATNWWKSQCRDFFENTTWRIEYDALWIDMNEPSNFVPGTISPEGCGDNSWNHPPYLPRTILGADQGSLYDKTICMEAPQAWGRHYDVHSLYGHGMSIVSWNTMRELWPDKRPFVLTRSQYVGTQKYAAHWLGDNQSLWEQIPWSIVAMLEYSLFGFSYTGADICGFWYATNEEMCQRWMQLGAFYPFSRNHNAATWPDQDPGSPLFSDELRRSSRNALLIRYKFLPYLYTLMYEAHTRGSTVARPLLHEFINDTTTHTIDKQFLWGAAFLISPALGQAQTVVRAYIPEGRWYDYHTSKEVTPTKDWHNFDTPLDKINLHVRGGYILPWQEPANNTFYSRENSMGLLVALGPAPYYTATGSLFWDDGESFETHSSNDEYYLGNFACSRVIDFACQLKVSHNTYAEAGNLIFDEINILGVTNRPSEITVDGTSHGDFEYDSNTRSLTLKSLNLNITEPHDIEWKLQI